MGAELEPRQERRLRPVPDRAEADGAPVLEGEIVEPGASPGAGEDAPAGAASGVCDNCAERGCPYPNDYCPCACHFGTWGRGHQEAEPADPGDGEGREDGDRPLSAALARRVAERQPVLPAWARDRAELAYASRWAAGHVGHVSAYHGVRAPKYAGRLAARAPRGAVRVGGALVRWTFDAESAPVRAEAVRRGDVRDYMRLLDRRNDRVRWRLIVLAGATAVGVAALAGLLTLTPPAVRVLALAAAVAALGVAGRPADRPLVDTVATTREQAPRLTGDAVVRALTSLGIGEINKAMGKGGEGVTFPAGRPVCRDGPGFRADVDLPRGVTPGMVIDRRDRLASGLRRPLGCVWPEGDPHEHEGRLVLWVGDHDMAKARQPAWPLERRGQGDVFAPMPFAVDQRMRQVPITLMFNSGLIGAMPRQGKSFALRVVTLIFALDPRVEIRAFDLKGVGDLSPLAKVAHQYAAGLDDATVQACFESLRELEGELERRAKVMQRLPRSMCPESKVTPALAARKDLGLHPVAFIVDECQELFTHPDRKLREEADRIAGRITKLGPAMGLMAWLATQRPDADSLPTGVAANAGIRFCLRVMGQLENDMVLGTSMYKNGFRATMFTDKDKGIGWLVGVTDDPQIARGFYIDAEKGDRIADRARGLREAAGTLSGHAIGEATTTGATDLLDDAAEAAAGDEKIWTETLLERLVNTRPEVYQTWSKAGLSGALKARGVDVGQRWIAGTNRQGVTVADLTAARAASTTASRGAPRSRTAPRDGDAP